MQTSTFSNEICAFHAVWFLFLNSFKIVCGIVLDTLVKKKKKNFLQSVWLSTKQSLIIIQILNHNSVKHEEYWFISLHVIIQDVWITSLWSEFIFKCCECWSCLSFLLHLAPSLHFDLYYNSTETFWSARRVWRYQWGNQKPYIEEEQTTQWPKEKVQKNKQRCAIHTYKTTDRVTRTSLKQTTIYKTYI